MKSFWLISSSLVVFGLCTLSADAKTSYLDEGTRQLNAGRYEHAQLYLRQAVHDQPRNPYCHYYLAHALVYLRRHDEAINEYSASYKLDPFGPVSGYCRRALMAYKVRIPDVAPDQVDAGAPEFAAPEISKNATNIGSTIDVIRRQAESEKGRHRLIADSMGSQVMKTGESEARRIQEDARQKIEEIYNPPPTINGRLTSPFLFDPQYQKAKADEVRRQADEAARLARERAQDKLAEYKKWGQDREYALDEVASNLENQLHSKPLRGSAVLREVGTGLFVRYYGSVGKNKDYPDYHQSVVRIRPVQTTKQDESDAESADTKSGDTSAEEKSGPERSVKGTVLK